ncbi:hypothetical protein RHGRI_019615 [Rhododendron griersonianum]|uniref:Disease resistance RPP13-like protein 1 n=1 Tax=Rhododendron griersonianum TaxID=479676 RepID=A0AAV6JD47_9ERIC|nr:hypothetical protein RHGRI_019615 [Rhododendron griersonianum]
MAGEALLGAALGVLLDRLASKEFTNFFGRKHDERLLKKLKLKLLGLNKVLNDAEDKQFTDRAVKEWLDELKGAVYDAEDLVDEIATEALRCKVEAECQSGSNQVQSLISSFTKLFDNEIESKLEKMIDTLEDFSNEKDVLGLKEVAGRNWSQTRLPTTSLVDESDVYGRENDKEEIMKLLLSDGESSNKLDVIPIVGMGGMGKTTLAQLLYNDGRLYGHFVEKRSNASTSLFVMHDLVHDLAQYVMGDFCYRMEDGKPCSKSEIVRHFSFVSRKLAGVNTFKVIKDAKCLRTFLQIDPMYGVEGWLSNKVLVEIISGMPRLLRLLTLPRYDVKELPYLIGKLIHLRFLDLSYSYITQLPESVCTLYNLETLLLSNCRSLTTLPVDLGKLISLRRLDLSKTSLKEMPVNISRLKDLQRLTAFVVGNCSGSGINGLKELNSLGGAITISGLENVTSGDDASEAKLKEKKQLESLTLEWGSTAEDSQKERDILENLEPPTNLKLLEIKNYGGTKFPNWLGDQPFGNMVQLCLEKCENCFSLPPLGQMPSLQTLTINDCPEIESFPEGGLPTALTRLDIKNCKKLKSLPEQMHTLLPSLKSLHLYDCPEIESFLEGDLPSSLTDLYIWNCKKLVGGRRDWGLQTLPSLKSFRLWSESEDVLESFPEEGLLPPTLTHLGFGGMPDLKSLNERGLQPLVSLEDMVITDCPQLQSLSVERLPTSLSELIISRCPLLEPRCRREEGEDWHKIAHIPRIYIG